MVKLSIVIPTLNEEKYLPKLLNSIKAQNFKDYEIIVADGKSKDKTRQIARKFGCKIVDGIGLPAIGRNNGAKVSRGAYFLFLDADVVLPDNFFTNVLAEFNKRKLDIAFCRPAPISAKFADKLVIGMYNVFVAAAQYVRPFGGGFCLLVKKNIHQKLNGFRENISYLEDVDYIQRTAKFSKFGILKPKIFLSMRRFEVDGRGHTFMRYVNTYVYRLVGYEVAGKLANDKRFSYSYDYKK